ncbi:unnamed protein product, partial [Closterium sp. Naga37s-1]
LPPVVSVESFVHAADHDGDGEIGPEEAHQLWARVLEEEKRFEEQEAEASGGEREREAGESETGGGESSMADLMSDHRLDMPFSYGGSSISTAEMSDHLSHMLTGEKVVAWIVHGLRLPQYAEVFRANSIDGLDFPTLISDNGTFLKEDLGVKSALHRHKIHTAIFRQVFGLGKAPGAPTNLECEPAGCGAIAVQWDPPANPGVPPVHKYLIQRRVATRVASWKDVGDTSEDAWLDSAGLKPGIEYTYRIQAWGGHGPSEWVVLDHCRALATSADGVACTMGVHPHQQQHHHQHHHQHQQHALKPPAMEPLGRPIAAGAEGHSHPHASDIVAVTGAEKQQGSGGSWQKRLESVGGTEYILSASTAPGPGVAAEEAVGRTIGGVGGQQGSRHGVAQSADQSAKEAEQEAERRGEESPSSPLWSFIWSVNGGILVLGIFSRHSFFFRFVLAAAASAHRLLRPLASALSPSPASPFLLVRVAARALLGLRAAAARVSALLHRVIAALVSPGDDEGGEDYELSPFPSGSRAARRWSDGLGDQADGGLGAGEGNALGEAGEAGGRGFRGGWGGGGGESWAAGGGMGGGQGMRRVGRNRSYDELSGRQEGEASFGSSEGGMPRNGLLARGGHEEARARVGEWRGEEGEGGGWGESGRVQEAASDEDTESMKSVSFKYRCNAEGCRVRFDRWYTLDGLRHSILKHYCRECQGVYCVRHTRISPHSSRTQCGLDSHCLCFSCYARLPAELQLRAERINKLRVGPVAGSGSSGSASLGNSFGGSGGGGGGRNGGGKNGEGVLNGSGNSNSFSSSGHGSSGSIRAGGNGDGGKGVGGKISPSSSWMTLLGRRNNDKSGGADKGGRERHVGGSLAESASTSGSDESQGAGAGGGVAGAVGAGGAGRTAEAGEAVSGSVLAAAAEAAGEEQDTGMVELSLAAADLLPAASPTSPDPSNGSSRATSEPDMGAPSKRPGAASGVADIWNSLQESQDLRSGTGSNALPNTPGEALACLTGKGPLPRSAASDPTSSCLASAARPTCSLEAIPSCSESVREAEESRGKGGGVAAAGGRCVKLEAAGSRGEGAGKRGETNGNGAIDWGRLERCPSHLSRSRSSRSADEVKRSPSPFSKVLSPYNELPSEGAQMGSRGRGGGTGGGSNWFWWYRHGGHRHGHGHGHGHREELKGSMSPALAFSGMFTSKRKLKEGSGKGTLGSDKGRGEAERGGQEEEGEVGNGGSRATSAFLSPFVSLASSFKRLFKRRSSPEPALQPQQHDVAGLVPEAAQQARKRGVPELETARTSQNGTSSRISSAAGNFFSQPPRPLQLSSSLADATGTAGRRPHAAHAGVADGGLAERAAGAAVAPRSPLQQGYSGEYGQHKQQTQRGMAQQGMAQQGVAQQGMAQQGMAQQGMAQQGMAQQGMARQGMAQQGMAQQGMAQQGMARQGMAQQGMAQAQGSGGVGHPDVYVYSTLFGLLGRGRDAANLARVVEEMREDGCEHNAVTLQSLATAYGRAGRWDEALATLGAMQGGDGGQSVLHDLTLIGPRVDTLFRMSRYVDAIKAFTELRSARHVPDSFVYNTVFTCYGRVGNSSGAEEAFKDMIRHGVPLDVRCANSLMDVYGRTGRVDDAMAVFDRMCLAAVAASGASHMKGGGGGGLARERGGNRSNADLPGAAAVAGIPPLIPHVAADNASTLHGSAARAITYSCAIHLLSMAGRLTEAEETFEAMLVAGKRHDTITWSTMVQMWAKEANLERAVMWFKRMVAAGCRPETPAYNSLMWAFVGRGMFDEAGEVLTALKNGWDLVGQVELVGRGEEQELKQGGSGKSVFGWLNPRGEGELGPGDANKGVAGAVSPSKQGNAKLELAPNLMTYTMFLSECTESAARSDVARLLRLMEETEHAAHTVFQLLTEEPFESTHTLLPAGAESDSESAPLSGAVCEAGSAAGCEASDGETRRCERESEGGSIQLPAISGQGGECFVDLHGMSAGTAVTVTKWALEKMRQAVVASAAAGAASGASAASSSVVSTVAISSTAANPTASGETAEGAIQGEEALVESLSPSESGAAESSRLHESPPAHPLQWQQPSKVAVVTGWGKRSRVQGASLVKAAVEALLLRDLTAPFSLHRFHPGSYEAPGADLEHWLLSPGVEQLLAPRDEG